MLVDIQWVTLLYILLGVIALSLLRVLLVTLRERAYSIFSLERENANARITRTINYLLLIFLLTFGVFYAQTQLMPRVPTLEITPTPTLIQLPPTSTPPILRPSTSTPTPSSPTPVTQPTLLLPSAPTLVFAPTAIPTPEPAQNGLRPNCPNAGVSITEPGDGAVVSGLISIFGAAYIDNFDYYKIEFRAPGQSEWSFIQRYNAPNYGGPIATWNTATVPPGTYDFRLVVVNNVGNYPTPCQIRLIVS